MNIENKFIRITFKKIIPILLILVYAVRLFCYKQSIGSYITLNSSPLGKVETVFSLLAIWLQYTAVTLVLISSFIKTKYTDAFTRYCTIPIFILNIILVNQICALLTDNNAVILKIMLIVESSLGIIISLYNLIKYYLLKEYKSTDAVLYNKSSKEKFLEIIKIIGVFVVLLIPSLPSYFVQFMFGYGRETIIIKEISFAHRVFLYIGFIIPMILYFLLRNKDENTIRYAMIYISVATMVGFLVNYNYTTILKPWAWPFHLCNTAMFIIPLCLIFKMKRLFYFTYFINVLGALLAMLMPNYDTSSNIFSMRVFNFWYNHWIAFFMPLLIVALKVFKRPKLKEFIYSMIGFFGYFVLALVMNVVFSAMNTVYPELRIGSVDYFFINSDFVADKLGTWAEKLFKITSVIRVGKLELVFHPFYQLSFFSVYVLLGLAVWFVYSEFFRIADDHYALHNKLIEIKIKEKLQKEHFGDNPLIRKEDAMSTSSIILKLDHFSKQYANSSRYAVNDANLEVYGGEIFGFLGPNGAGKSTIIKSIVGIQTITSGNIDICGFDVASKPVEAKYNIGYVPDHYALYEKLTGREYINYIADIYDVSLEDRCGRIEKYIKLFELENSIDNKIKTYSHGMKQKITIMAALVHEPKVWILDEPLTGLDPNSIFQVKECMKRHAEKGNIVFFSSHIIDIVEKLCKRIAIIKHGKIMCVKTIEEIENMVDDDGTKMTLEKYYMKTIGNNEE